MEINVYDPDMIPLGVIDEITSFLWIRRYWNCGEFKLLVPFTLKHGALLHKYRIIMKNGDTHAAQIRHVNIKKNKEGLEEIEVQGKMLLWWLDKRIVREQIVTRDNTQNILYRMLRENGTAPAAASRRLPGLSITTAADLGSGIIDYVSEPFISLMLACENAARAAKLGVEVITDVRACRHYFSVYKGRELTADQTDNPPCIFSQEFDNILDQEYTNSVENLKTVAYVGGEEREDITRKIVEVGTASGMDRDEVFINATDITQTYTENGEEITIPDAQYLNMLMQRGASELEQYAETLNFSSTINTNTNLQYGVDFDLGDRVTCVDKRWGIKINVRITEVTEIYQEGNMDIDVSFGESLPTLIEQIRKLG